MHTLEKLYSSHDERYDRLLDGVAEHILATIVATRNTAFQVFLRYVDNALPEESFHEWLHVEYPIPVTIEAPINCVAIPSYEFTEDIVEHFDRFPAMEGRVDDYYLQNLGRVAVDVNQ